MHDEHRYGSYHADHERTLNDVALGSDDAGRTDTLSVDTRAAVLAVEQVTAGDGAVGADKAGTTGTAPDAVARAAVTTRVIRRAVGRGAGVTGERRRTTAAVAVDQVVASATVVTRTARTFVQVRLADLA